MLRSQSARRTTTRAHDAAITAAPCGVGQAADGYQILVVVQVGTSGWSYDHWKGVLYEAGVSSGERLRRYAEEFDTVELNASFYRWPGDGRFGQWRDQLPAGFTMSVKAPRGLTHGKRLRSPEQWVERIARAWDELSDHRGAILAPEGSTWTAICER